MRRNIYVLLLYCSIVILLLGCAGLPKREALSKSESLLEPQAILKFSDVPVPVGFKLLSSDSYAFEASGIRVGILKYKGKANPDQVVNFYKDQMQLYNWNLLNAIEYGDRLLNFERETESCIITISPKGNNITIIISLGPKSQARPKKIDKPVK